MLELTPRETKRYSIANAIAVDAARRLGDRRANSFEAEISEQLERALGAIHSGYQRRGGLLIPTGVSLVHQRAGLDTKTPTKGAELVFDEAGSFIDLLRPACWVLKFGATFLPGLKGDVGFPRAVDGATVTFAVENPGVDTAESELELERVWLTPKIAQATTSYSRQLLAQSTPAVDGVVANDLAKAHGVALDYAALNHATAGILNKAILEFAGGADYATAVGMETEILLANAGADPRGLAYLADPETAGTLKVTAQGTGIAMACWYEGQMNGHRAEATTNMPAPSLLLGDWPDVLIGEWGVLELITDPYRLKKRGMIEVTSFHMVDAELRHLESFCKATGITTTAAAGRAGARQKEKGKK